MTNAPQTTADAKPWAESPQDVLELLDASSGGLSGTEAARRLERDGSNTLPEPTQKPAWRRLLAHFDDVLIYILIAAAVLKAISGDWIDFAVISVVIVATAVIGFIQEGRAASNFRPIRRIFSAAAQVEQHLTRADAGVESGALQGEDGLFTDPARRYSDHTQQAHFV